MIAQPLAALVLVGLVAGCAKPCTSAGVEGSYRLNARGTIYALELKADGRGTLGVSGRAAGELRWILGSSSDQQIIEIDATGPAYAALRAILPEKENVAGAVVPTSGVFAPAPVCSRSGRMSNLVLDFDEGIEFRRSED